MPTYSPARMFRAGLPGVNISSNFPIVAPGVYNRNNPSPFGFKNSPGYQLPTTAPLEGYRLPQSAPELEGNGARLPVGDPVEGDVPGVFESGTSQPWVNDPLPGAPRSRLTLRQVPGGDTRDAGSRLNDPAYQQTAANGTAAALAQIYGAGASSGAAGARSVSRGAGEGAGYNPIAEMGNAGRVLEAAAGLEGERVAYSARDMMGRPSARSFNARGEMLDQGANAPLGSPLLSDRVVSPFDPPEVRASKQRYGEMKIREAAGREMMRGADGGAPSTQDMAGEFNRLSAQAGRKPMPGSAGTRKEEIEGVGTLVRDNATGELVDSGKINKPDDKKNEQKSLTQTEIQSINSLQQAGRDLSSLEGAFKEIGDKDFGGPIAGRARSGLNAVLGNDPNVTRIKNLVTAATPNLARGVFRETGVLTDADVERYKVLLPNVNDTPAQRSQKIADLRKRQVETIDEQLATLKAAGRDVTGLREKILGDAAKKTAASGAGGATYKDADGTEHPIREIKGRGRGIIKDGKFYPIVGQ